MKEDPLEELLSECYICFEPCSQQSKCNCKTYVHKKCLEYFIRKSGSDHCNVCLYKFKKPKKLQCTYYRSFGVSLFKCFVIYIVAGFIGQIIYYWASQKNIVLLAPWTDIFALSSIVVICVIVFLYAFIKRYLITL